MDHFQGGIYRLCSWLVRHVNNCSRLIRTALSPFPFLYSRSVIQSCHVMWFKSKIHMARTFKNPPKPSQRNKETKQPELLLFPPARPLYATQQIQSHGDKQRKLVVHTLQNTTGKLRRPANFHSAVSRPQRRPLNKGVKMIWTRKKKQNWLSDWWAVPKLWSSFQLRCDWTKDKKKIKKNKSEREIRFPRPDHLWSSPIVSDHLRTTSDQLPTQRSVATTMTTRPPPLETKRFCGFCFQIHLMAQPRTLSLPPDVFSVEPLVEGFSIAFSWWKSSQDEEGGTEVWATRVLPFQNSHSTGQIQEVKSFGGGWVGSGGGRRKEWQVGGWGRRRRRRSGGGGGLSQLCGAPGFGRCDGTAQSCFRWSFMSSSSVYSDGSSPGFSNLPT